MPERPLPCSLDSEKLVLGSLLSGDLDFRQASEVVGIDDFSIETHRRIFTRMGEIHERGDAINTITVFEALKAHAQHESCGGLTCLVGLESDSIPINLESYLRRIRETSLLRQTIRVCECTSEQCYAAKDAPGELLQRAETMLRDLSQASAPARGLRTITQVIEADPRGLQGILNPHQDIRGIKSPWPTLNHIVTSFNAPDLVVLAARPGYGKSASAAQIAVSAAEKGCGVALFSLEMSSSSILQRMACARAGVDSHAFRQGRVTDSERRKIQGALSDLADMPLFLDDATGCSVPAIHGAIRKLKARVSVGLAIVDYLQLLQGVGRKENRTQEVSEISRGLKLLAVEFGLPVIALSQLSRGPEHERRRPVLADLRESGSIEQDADVVIFIHWPDAGKNGTSPTGEVEFIVAKQRSGPVGKINLFFNASLCRFEDRTAEEEPCRQYAID